MATIPTFEVPSSYQKYKEDTNAFLSWLLRAAQMCGYKWTPKATRQDAQQSGVKLKVAGGTMPVAEIYIQARIVCSGTSPSSFLPKTVAKLAKRAISGRRAYTAKYDKLGQSNDSHKFFTDSLQEALDMLEAHVADQPRNAQGLAPQTKQQPGLHNVFANLELEDCADDPEPQAGNSHHQSNRGKISTQHDAIVVEIEDDDMRIECFFEDLWELRSQVLDLWQQWSSDDMGLLPVAMATNAAIALAEQMEQELFAAIFPDGDPIAKINTPFLGVASTYSTLLGYMTKVPRGMSIDISVIWLSDTSLFFMDMAVILSKIAAGFKRHSESDTFAGLRKAIAKGNLSEDSEQYLWPPIETLEAMCIRTTFFKSDVDTNSLMQSPTFRSLARKDDFLAPLVANIVLHNEYMLCLRSTNHRASHIDMASQAFCRLRNGKIDAGAILGCAILWDLHTHLGDRTSQLYSMLTDYAEETRDLVKHAFPDVTGETPTGGPYWVKNDVMLAGMILNLHSVVVLQPEWAKNKTCMFLAQGPDTSEKRPAVTLSTEDAVSRIVEQKSGNLISPEGKLNEFVIRDLAKSIQAEITPERPFIPADGYSLRHWTKNPIACGTMMFNLALAREQAGISLANGHLSIVLAAYLYVSGKHIRKAFEGNWKEMDEVVHTHIDAMFFGKLPDTPHKMHATWILRLGGIPWSRGSRTNVRINLAFRGGDRTGKLPAKKSQASCLSTSDTANFLCQWHEGKETMIKTIHSIHRVMQTMETKCVRIHSEFELITDFVNRSDKVSKHAKLQPLNFLPALVEHVSADCQRFNIDYITLTRTCNGLLGALVDRNMLKSEIELVKAFPDHYEHHPFCQFFGDMKTIMSNPVHVVDGLIMSDRVWHDTSDSDEFRRILKVDKKRGKKQNESWTDPSPMFVVADFVQKYLDERKMLVHSGEDVVDQQDLRDRVYFSQFLGRFMEKLGSGSVREVFDEMPPPEGLWGLNSLASEAKQGTSTGEVKVPTGKKTQVRLEEVVDEDFVGD